MCLKFLHSTLRLRIEFLNNLNTSLRRHAPLSSSFQCLKLWCILIPYPWMWLVYLYRFLTWHSAQWAWCKPAFLFCPYIHAAGHLMDLFNRETHLLPFWEVFLNYCFDNFVPFLLFSYLQFLLIFFFFTMFIGSLIYLFSTAFYFFLPSSFLSFIFVVSVLGRGRFSQYWLLEKNLSIYFFLEVTLLVTKFVEGRPRQSWCFWQIYRIKSQVKPSPLTWFIILSQLCFL